MAAQDTSEGARWSRETLVDVKKARISSISSKLCSMACSFAVAESIGACTALGSCTLAESCSYCRSCLLTNPSGETFVRRGVFLDWVVLRFAALDFGNFLLSSMAHQV